MSEWHFHRECIYYDTVEKIPKPEPRHPNRCHIKCAKTKGMHYYCDSDFENIRTSCTAFEPKEQNIFDFMENEDG